MTDISQDAICNILKEFTGQEAAAVLYRIRERLTYSQIGLRLGVTKERTHQILSKALRKLRHRSGGVVRKIDNGRLEVGDIRFDGSSSEYYCLQGKGNKGIH